MFVDESIHDRGGFILASIIYCPTSPRAPVCDALRAVGMQPGVDEYRSGRIKRGDTVQAELRERLLSIVGQCRIAVAVVPRDLRPALGQELLGATAFVIRENQLSADGLEVYFDEGIFSSPRGSAIASASSLPPGIRFYPASDSKKVVGLQLADLVAHSSSTMLLETLGLVNKTVKAGEDSGYDPELDLSIGFELWAGLRYSFFRRPRSGQNGDTQDPFFDGTCGLYVSAACDKRLSAACLRRFGTCYVGCIH